VASQVAKVIGKSVAVSHPRTAAHLHTPVAVPALAAEIVISTLNQSMDSFDQAPAATVIEQMVCRWICHLAGLPDSADGSFTAGGTQSNYMGLLLARDHFLATRWQWCARVKGLPPEASHLRILCSDAAHFSVEKAAIQLGLGTSAVVRVPCDRGFRMQPTELDRMITGLRAQGLEPFAVVATAGTTDFGSFEPLTAIASIARLHRLWMHVDAAYGGALLLSQKHRHRLEGLELADSIAIDFHKAFFQPISCGAFLLADSKRFDLIRVHADYLNSEERESDGVPDLVTRSVLTTRRFEALKLWISLQAIGEEQFGAMIDQLAQLASGAAARLEASGEFEVLHQPEFGCVVFRFRGDSAQDAEGINRAIPQNLFASGTAVIGHTMVRGKGCLKLTFSNPCTTAKEVEQLLDTIAVCGRRLAAALKNPLVAVYPGSL
jgi:L-2,4-diaminobutyrate decarboxylase